MRRAGTNLSVSIAFAFVLTCVCSLDVQTQVTGDAFRKRLVEKALFLPSEQKELDEGQIVVKALPTKNKQIVSVLGVIRLKDISAVSMDDFRASLAQRRNKTMTGGGKFSEPPAADDLKDLELKDKDFKVLKKCSVGDCDMNMSAEMIRKFTIDVNWNADDHKERATALFREMLLGYVNGYTANGDVNLGNYANRKETVDLAAAHKSLLTNSLFLDDLSPEVYGYLAGFPAKQLGGMSSEMHWSTIDFGLKPAITLTHSVAFDGSQNGVLRFIVANKQIYASRYLDASLSFTILMGTGANEPGGYLIFADRSQSDALDGLLSGVARSVVEKEAVEKVRDVLQNAEIRLIAGNKQSEPDAGTPDGPSIGNQIVEWFRQPIGIIVLLALAGIAIFSLSRVKRNRR